VFFQHFVKGICFAAAPSDFARERNSMHLVAQRRGDHAKEMEQRLTERNPLWQLSLRRPGS
jgi:hypothetical protein